MVGRFESDLPFALIKIELAPVFPANLSIHLLQGIDCLYHESFTNCRFNNYSRLFRRHDSGGNIFEQKE